MTNELNPPQVDPPYFDLTCPNCACNHFLPTDHPNRKRCRCCGRVVRYQYEGQSYHRMRCPACKSPRVVTTSTQGKLRYHKCRVCSCSFKSIEE
jgi:hypothetical protein